LSALLFAPTQAAVDNLGNEGIIKGVCRTGDIMYDTSIMLKEKIGIMSENILKKYELEAGNYGLVTVHREENTSMEKNWKGIILGLKKAAEKGLPLVWPVHPRIKDKVKGIGILNMKLLGPLPYMEMQALLSRAKVVMTDSGGLQKEAYFYSVPCLTLRNETEWVELVDEGVNYTVGTDPNKIFKLALNLKVDKNKFKKKIYGDGKASEKIASKIRSFLS
jgi:UDP-GlcNAc3NAcA epimerase